ncbi:MAG: putative Zn-dependent protease [Halioglobus sp.]|jgi:predicted Zn-dependent protease
MNLIIFNRALRKCITLAFAGALFLASSATSNELKLPNLGESSTSLFSADFEHQLGRTWLRAFRSQVRTIDDPVLQGYLENLIYNLATHSQLEDRRIEVIIVDNPTINAFAVPGGIIGIHNGLLLYAQTEDELATVLAHELGHLSQRHFSRSVEYQKSMGPLNLAAMLAGLVLLATTGSEAGIAVLTAAQAAAQDSALRYSRGNEQEADRVGMQTMVAAGMDPHAAPAMFERMLQASRYSGGNRVPEFLRSHPLSENRIADTRNRARKYPKTMKHTNLDYQLMRARVVTQLAKTPEQAVQRFQGELAGSSRSREAARYGLTLALTAAGRPDEAITQLAPLWAADKNRMEYILADAEIDMARNQPQIAAEKLAKQLLVSPENHPLTMAYANALMNNQQAHIAEEVLVAQSKIKPKDPGVWYLLAEVQGLSGNIVGLHLARAEYFILNGIFDEADRQLNYALKLSSVDHLTSAKINHRLQDVSELRAQMDL